MITPIAVIAGDAIVGLLASVPEMSLDVSAASALARPKSSSLTVPSLLTFTLAGFRSRWMKPSSCAASSASAICRAMGSASASGIGPRAMWTERSSPSTSSITIAT